MGLRFFIGTMLLFLAGCQSTGSSYGEGAIKLSERAYRGFQDYLDGVPLTFAVTEDGQNFFYYYCMEFGCDPIRTNPKALYRCEQRHGRPCKIFAIRDQIVWKNPGDWVPEIVSQLDSNPTLVRSKVEEIHEALAGNETFERYRHAPGHKALVAMVNDENGEVRFWGVSYGHATVEKAIEVAHSFCSGGYQNNRARSCLVVEANDVDLWPMHMDDLTPAQISRSTKEGSSIPFLQGTRPISISWPGRDTHTGDLSYKFGLGRIEFNFGYGQSAVPCAGNAEIGEQLGNLSFTLSCKDGSQVAGEGIYALSGKEVVLNGEDQSGNTVSINVGPDPSF